LVGNKTMPVYIVTLLRNFEEESEGMMYYYCENCCTIHHEQHICQECGCNRLNPIIIEVQCHKYDRNLFEEE
jgi:thymidine kinase